MNHGLNSETLAVIRRVLAAHEQVESAILYGSRAKGVHRPGSDIDLALTGDAVDASLVRRIAGELDESSLPYRFDVALLSQLQHPPLVEHIARVGVPIYERNAAPAKR